MKLLTLDLGTTTGWASIPDWPEYEVSICGQVRRIGKAQGSKVGRILKPWVSLGYPYVSLWRENKKTTVAVHRLVAATYLKKPKEGQYQVAHIDGNRMNPHAHNLKWATPIENAQDRKTHGTDAIGQNNPQSKLLNSDIPKIRKLRKNGLTQKKISEMFGVSRALISDIENGRRWATIK